jgi:hypothetical protein
VPQADRSTDRSASAKQPLSAFLESSTPIYLAGALIGATVAAGLILSLATML